MAAAVSAFVDMEYFYVDGNSLTGSLPASLSAWKKVMWFSVNGNEFTGVVPALDFGAMTKRCYLLYIPASNAFSCPFPQGVTEKCKRDDDTPITNADCHAPTPAPTPAPTSAAGCTGASAGLVLEQCTAWQKFWDGAGGPNWTGYAKSCSKQDPCGSCGAISKIGAVLCSGNGVYHNGGSITLM